MDDDTFHWRPLALRLTRSWRRVALAAAVASAVGLILSLVLVERFVAEALLAVTKPALAARFDERLQERQPDPGFPYQVATLRAYAELARTEAVARDVADRPEAPGQDPQRLLERVRVRALADGSLLVVSARGADPAAAAALANAWSEALIRRTGNLYSGLPAGDEVIAQRDLAAADVAESDARLVQFQRRRGPDARKLELEDLQLRYEGLLGALRRLEAVERDAGALEALVAGGASPDAGHRLAALTLRLGALTLEGDLPLELQLAAADLDVGAGSVQLNDLRRSASGTRAALERDAHLVAERLAEASAVLEEVSAERSALERARALAAERYLALARKSDEVEILLATAGTELRLAAGAEPPPGADWLTPLRHALVAAVLGALVGAAWVLGRPWRPAPGEPRQEAAR